VVARVRHEKPPREAGATIVVQGEKEFVDLTEVCSTKVGVWGGEGMGVSAPVGSVAPARSGRVLIRFVLDG
jgi:hypothetical protein